MSDQRTPSFARGRKWIFGLNLLIDFVAVLALLVMANYLGARHYARTDLSAAAKSRLSPLTEQILAGLTNDVRVTIYFDKRGPLYQQVWDLLREYKFRSSRLSVETVDYELDPAAATLVKQRYGFTNLGEKDIVIFDSQGRVRIVEHKQLSDLDIGALTRGESREVRRTHFRGEMEFTSALLSVVNPQVVKAYFLQGHGEHRPDDDDNVFGYSVFGEVLRESNVEFAKLELGTVPDVPADCRLLIIAGPRTPFLADELEKIERYLKQGGRLFALFHYFGLFQHAASRPLGLERVLANWGIAVGNNVVQESRGRTVSGKDVIVSTYNSHPITQPFFESRLMLVLPRSISPLPREARGSEVPQAEPLIFTTENARVHTDIRRDGSIQPTAGDFRGTVPLMVAVEQGGIPGVTAARGATRIVAAGDSSFLGNEIIVNGANREFGKQIVHWLLARNELLATLGPRPIKEYKLLMTEGQLSSVRWILLAGFPGAVLLIGTLVWMRRRR